MTRTLLVAVLLISACGKSAEERGREEVAASQTPDKLPEPAKAQQMGSAAPVGSAPAKPPEPAMPEPTTPEEIDKARKQAMLDLRDKDVIKYCEMTKFDAKTDPQILLGCALAACRVQDTERARNWAKTLPKLLMDQAVKVCTANGVAVKPVQ